MSFRRSPRVLLRGAPLLLLVLASCRPAGDESPGVRSLEPRQGPSEALLFVDVTSEVGLDSFRQVNGGAEKKYLPETTGAGVALFDADGDGAVDVFLVNGAHSMMSAEAQDSPTNRLFLNQGGGESFVDVTADAGLLSHGAFGQGCAVADVDGDGGLDLYVTNYGRNAFYLHRGGAPGAPVFEEVAAAAGIDVPEWSTGAAFFDYDRDGDLDLYVANFVDYERFLDQHRGRELPTQNWNGAQVVKGPRGLPAAGDRLFRNDGPSAFSPVVFTDVTGSAGIDTVEPSYGFQPAVGDVDGDLFPDLFVANDSRPNFLWKNLEGRGFREIGLASGVACDRSGNNQACMGVAFDDYDGDGWLDLFVTNFAADFNTLYRGDASGFFHDDTAASGLWGPRTRESLAWGTFFFDADNDGDLDLFIANGHVYPGVDDLGIGESYAQTNELFERMPDGRYRDVSTEAGEGLAVARSSRGAAFGDLDDDGDLDVVVNNLDDRPTVLRNNSRADGHWLKVLLRGGDGNRSAIGARVRVEAGGRTHSRVVRSSDSYVSHHDLRLHFGLGTDERVERLSIDWPDGSSESFPGTEAGVLVVVEQTRGIVASSPIR